MIITTIAGTGHTIAVTSDDASDLAGHTALVQRLHAALRDAGVFDAPVRRAVIQTPAQETTPVAQDTEDAAGPPPPLPSSLDYDLIAPADFREDSDEDDWDDEEEWDEEDASLGSLGFRFGGLGGGSSADPEIVQGAQGWFHDLRTQEQKDADARDAAIVPPTHSTPHFPTEPGVYTIATARDALLPIPQDERNRPVSISPNKFLGVIVGRDEPSVATASTVQDAEDSASTVIRTTPRSTATLAVGYDAERRVLLVVYTSGVRYDYFDVAPTVWVDLCRTMDQGGSVGRFVNQHVKVDENGVEREFTQKGLVAV